MLIKILAYLIHIISFPFTPLFFFTSFDLEFLFSSNLIKLAVCVLILFFYFFSFDVYK